MNPSPATEERIWAVVSHLSALALGMGIALPIVGWSEQRHKSRYATFQCLQALGYQSLGYTIWLLASLVLVILLLVVFAFTTPAIKNDSRAILPWMFIFLLFILGIFGLYLLLPVIAAIACALGRDFRYPVMGRKLASYLGDPGTLNEEREDRWVAAMGHFSVIILLWGLLAPAATWVLQARGNTFLKFQSIQTTLYQAGINILFLGAMLLSFMGTVPVFALTGLEGAPTGLSPAAMVGLVLFLLSMLAASLILLVIPLFHILGQWAGYRLLKGDNYRYPLLGKLVEKRLAKGSYGDREPGPVGGSPPDPTKETS